MVAITTPAQNATLSGIAGVTASSSDNIGVTKVELYVDGTFAATTTTPPYTFSLNTTAFINGVHTLSAKSYDAAGNVGSSTNISVTMANIPTVPQSVSVSKTTASTVSLAWSASTESGGMVAGYRVYRGGVQVGTSATTSFMDSNLAPNASYAYAVAAYDASGNLSAQSASVSGSTGISPSFFSMDVHDLSHTLPTQSGLSPAGIRLWDVATRWDQIESSSNTFTWTTLDAFLASAAANHQDVLYAFAGVPSWISSSSTDATCGESAGMCDPPTDVNADGSGSDAAFKGFVTALMQHLRDTGQTINNFEAWNEVNNTNFWKGTAAQSVRMAYDARTIIKQFSPTSVVLTPSTCNCNNKSFTANTYATTNPQDAMNYYLKTSITVNSTSVTGAMQADGIGFHTYLGSTVPEGIVNLITKMQGVMATDGVGTLPLIDTESSWGKNQILTGCTANPPFTTDCLDMMSAFETRELILAASKGVLRFYWYQWGNLAYGTMYDSQTNTVLQPANDYATTEKWVADNPLAPCAQNGTVWTCAIAGGGAYQAIIAWDTAQSCSNGTCTTSNFNPGGAFTDYQTLAGGGPTPISNNIVPIGMKPVLIEN